MTEGVWGRARLLGSPVFEIDRHRYEVPATKASAVLLYLAHRADWVHRDELLIVFYAEDSGRSARSSLRQLLASIRKLPYAAGVEVEAHRVRWRIESDLQEFSRVLAQDRLWDAANAYRGQFLQGFEIRNAPEFNEWLTATRQGIHSQWRQATWKLADRLVQRDRLPDAVEHMARVRRLDPWDEDVLTRYIQLLVLAGRESEALDEFRAFADMIARELGAEPAVTTTQAVEGLLRHRSFEPRLVAGVSARGTRSMPSARSKHNLPRDGTSFVGRQAEIAQLTSLVGAPGNRLITITGPGGIGKTRLALQMAASEVGNFEDGVWFVRLESATSRDEVVLKIADAVGCTFTERAHPEPQLIAHLHDWHALLVLDNFEHVLDATPLVMGLLSSCHSAKLLITSRASLRIGAERRFVVPPLGLPHLDAGASSLPESDAVRLFIDRARAVVADFAVTPTSVAWIAAICVHLEGLPLAIELAAARINTFNLETLLSKLAERLPVLSGGPRDAPDRHRTLRHTIEWSYLLLAPAEQEMFRALSVFRGGFTLTAAEGISPVGAPNEVMDIIGSLVDQSLVVREPGSEFELRFGMLEAIREYAADALDRKGHRSRMRTAHLSYITRTAAFHAAELSELADAERHLAWFEAERENWRAAVEWGLESDCETAIHLTLALAAFWKHRPELEGARWLAAVLDLGGIPVEALYKLLLASGQLADVCMGDVGRAREQLERSLSLARDAGDAHVALQAIPPLIMVALQQGDTERGSSLAQEGIDLARRLDDLPMLAHILIRSGIVAFAQGQRHEATARFAEGRASARSCGRRDQELWSLYYLGALALLTGDTQGAKSLLADVGQPPAEAGTIYSMHALESVARALIEEGDLARAGELLSQILSFYLVSGVKLCLAHVIDAIARLSLAQADPRTATVLLGAVQGLLDTQTVALLPIERAHFEESMERAKASLSGEALAEAWSRGLALSVLDACECAAEVARGVRPPSLT